jgi:cytochrome b
VNATDKRFFWLALYAQPALWVGLAILALVKLEFIWLTLVGVYTLSHVIMGSFAGCWANVLVYNSHCARPHDHEYAGFLTMR